MEVFKLFLFANTATQSSIHMRIFSTISVIINNLHTMAFIFIRKFIFSFLKKIIIYYYNINFKNSLNNFHFLGIPSAPFYTENQRDIVAIWIFKNYKLF
jgi:hypothetical protein